MTITFPSLNGQSLITVRAALIHSVIFSEGATKETAALWSAFAGAAPIVGKHWIVEGANFRHLGKYDPDQNLASQWRLALQKEQKQWTLV